MFTLTVTAKGHKDKVYTLDDATNIIGRLESNLIFLDASYGVSRNHLKITPLNENSWKVECLSNLGGLVFNGKEVSECIIQDNDSFSLQSYTFTLRKEKGESKKENISADLKSSSDENLKESASSDHEPSVPTFNSEDSHSKLPFAPDDNPDLQKQKTPSFPSKIEEYSQFTEAPTVMPQLNSYLKPYLIVSLSEDEEDQVIELNDRDLWIVGRDPSSDICIEDINISRHHFKIIKKGMDFFIEDLGSSNGTSLNNKIIKPKETLPLNSGDIISILSIEIYFEIRNVNFEKKQGINLPVKVPSSADPPLLSMESSQSKSPSQNPENPTPFNAPAIIPNAILSETIITSIPEKKSSKKRLLIISLIILMFGGILFLLSESKKGKKSDQENSEELNTGTFESLTLEEKENVKNLYILAQQQYQMKKFELCNQTLTQLHDIIPFYQESQDLITTCQSGAESVQIQLEIENQKKQEEQERKKLREIVSLCKNKFKSFRTLEALEECLAEATTIDPEDEELNILKLNFESQETAKKQRAEELQNLKNRVKKETKIYNEAKKLKDSDGQILKAIAAYKKFLLRNHPVVMDKVVQTARDELFKMESTVQSQIKSFMDECQELLDSKKYKQAHQICQKVLTVSPKNQKAQQAMDTSIKELNEKLKPLFNESVINESLGQVEIAKKQWVFIIEQDIPDGKYSFKAQKKLSKY